MTVSDVEFARDVFDKFKREWDNVEKRHPTGIKTILSVTFYDTAETYTTNNPITTVRLGDEYNGHIVDAIQVEFYPQRSPDITFMHKRAVTILPNVKLANFYASVYV